MAVPAEALVPTCKFGHPLTEDNLAYDRHSRTGKRYARCQTCKRESVRKSRARLSAEQAPAVSMLMPRGGASARVEVNAYAMQPLFNLIGKPLRDGVAAVLADDTVDQLQRNVIRRVAYRRRGWVSASPDVSERWFIEHLLEETVDARSSLLRIDTLLRLIYLGR